MLVVSRVAFFRLAPEFRSIGENLYNKILKNGRSVKTHSSWNYILIEGIGDLGLG